MRHQERCVFWERPADRADLRNSLTDAAVSLPPGKILVYEMGPPGGLMGDGMRRHVMGAAAGVAARLGLALVQWPDGPADAPRRWVYGLQRRSR